MDWDALYSFKKKFLIDFTQIMLCWTWSRRRGLFSLFSIRHTWIHSTVSLPQPIFRFKWLSNDSHCHYLLSSGANVSILNQNHAKRFSNWHLKFFLWFSWISASSSMLQNIELICSLVKRSFLVRAGIRRN